MKIKQEYQLQSTIEDIANSISEQKIAYGNLALDTAKELLKICPKELYQNIDEMVQHKSFSNINITFYIDNKLQKMDANLLKYKFCYGIPADYHILYALSLQKLNYTGISWLIDNYQEQFKNEYKKTICNK